MCSLLFVAVPSQRKRIYVYIYIYTVHYVFMYITCIYSTHLHLHLFLHLPISQSNHWFTPLPPFQSNTTEFIPYLYLFSDNQKPGCHYSKYIYLLARPACVVSIFCPVHHHLTKMSSLLRDNYSVGPSLLLQFPLMWIPFSSC